MTSPRFEPGSFRDRDGRVFYREGVVHRGLSAAAWEVWRALAASRFFARATAAGRIVPTAEAALGEEELRALDDGWVYHARPRS